MRQSQNDLQRKTLLRLMGLPALASCMLVSFLSVACFAQSHWKVVFSQPDGDMQRAAFFLDEQEGFIAGYLTHGIYRTLDGGVTWTNFPVGTNPQCYATSIVMIDAQHGWLTCESTTDGLNALYRTTNGGQTWISDGTIANASDVSQTSNALIVSNRFGSGCISTDGGATFLNAIDSTNGLAFVDNLHGVATGFHNRNWFQTIDGGRTWNPLPPQDTDESWGVYGVKGTSWFFAAPENDTRANIGALPLTTMRYSSDNGATWIAGTKLSFHSTGALQGVGFTLYVQDTNTGSLYRSMDSGKTWVDVGGPVIVSHSQTQSAQILDTRFAVTGCRGEVIYAFDDQGDVYKTTDGGDGALADMQLPIGALAVDSIDPCSPRDTTITIRNLGCDTVIVTGASTPASPNLTILDPTTGLVPRFPLIVPMYDSVKLELQLQSTTAGTFQSKVYLTVERLGQITYDTIPVTSTVKWFNPLELSADPGFDTTGLCQSHDADVALVNPSCFSIQILSAQLKFGTNFVLDSNYTSDSIPADSDKTFAVRFAPSKLGQLADSLILTLDILGKSVRESIPVTGVGGISALDSPELVMNDRFGNPLPNKIDFDTITRCSDSIFAFTIHEQGCDSLFVTVQWLDSTKTKTPPSSQFKWYTPSNQWITNLDTVVDGIEALPTVLGSYEGYLRISDSLIGSPAKVVSFIPYNVFVKPGTRTLSLDTTQRNFDTILFCDSRAIAIPIVNLGCDTIHVSSLTLGTANFVMNGPPYVPFVVNPGDTVYDTVQYVPIVSRTAMDTMTIVTDADSAPARMIPLLGYATPTDTIVFHAIASNLVVTPGDTTTISVRAGSAFAGTGLDAVKIVLAYNSDVMSPLDPQNSAHSSMTGSPSVTVQPSLPGGTKLNDLTLVISGSDMTFDSATPIVELPFWVTLSDSLSTDFHIASFVLNNGDYTFNKCLLGSNIDTGTITLQFLCGDTILYNLLRYGSVWSPDYGIVPIPGTVRPDPVEQGSILTIPFMATRSVSVRIDIFNQTGAIVYTTNGNFPTSGSQSIVLDNPPLRSGAYHYRLHPSDGGTGVATGSFVVIR